MKEIKIGRITLSFMFIALGIAMLLEKFIDYRIMDAIVVFWPVIIVFFGLEIIYSYFYIKLDNNRDKKIDILSTSIILMFVAILGLSNISKTHIKFRYSDDISEEVKLKDAKKIIIDDSNIDIVIKRSKDENCNIRLEGSYKHNNKEDYKNKTKFIKQDNKGQAIRISRSVDIRNRNIKKIITRDMKYSIEVPSGIEVELISNYGNIDIEDIKSNISIVSNYGDVKLEDIVGNMSIENSYGDLIGEDINGSIFIKSNNGDISIKSSKIKDKNLDIYCDFGDILLELPKQQTGKFNMITTYGNIYDELGFDIIESASSRGINQTRKTLKPNFNIRINNGDIILKED